MPKVMLAADKEPPKPPRPLMAGECDRCRRFRGHADGCPMRSPYSREGITFEQLQAERERVAKERADLAHTRRIFTGQAWTLD
jgi:hypothetical protein